MTDNPLDRAFRNITLVMVSVGRATHPGEVFRRSWLPYTESRIEKLMRIMMKRGLIAYNTQTRLYYLAPRTIPGPVKTERDSVIPEKRKQAMEPKQQVIKLPYPPSVNTIYRHAVRGKHSVMFMTQRGKDYQKEVDAHVRSSNSIKFGDARLSMHVLVYPPDRRKRDLGNLDKVLSDSLMHAGLFTDDSQIDDLRFVRREIIKGGAVVVRLTEIREIEKQDAPR